MRRNQRHQAAIEEPSWWQPEDDETELPYEADSQYDSLLSEDDDAPLDLLTHSAPPLRLITEQDPPPPDPPRPVVAVADLPVAQAARGLSPAPILADPGAAQLATCFAIDYLSWDATNPGRRAAALTQYSPTFAGRSGSQVGWSGHGRQRASFAVAGATQPDAHDPALVWIDVRALITRYEPTSPETPRSSTVPPSTGQLPAEIGTHPSSSPAPDVSGWRALDGEWVHISVPITHDESGQPHINPDHERTNHLPFRRAGTDAATTAHNTTAHNSTAHDSTAHDIAAHDSGASDHTVPSEGA